MGKELVRSEMIRILKLEPAHVPQIAALEKKCFSDPWSQRSIAGELENPLSLWLTAVDGDRVLGYIGSQAVLDEADMMNLAVDPNFRRRGIGQALIGALTDHLTENGVRRLFLEVRVSNIAARTLYEKLGFVQVGLRPKYYVNPREDALILRKELGK